MVKKTKSKLPTVTKIKVAKHIGNNLSDISLVSGRKGALPKAIDYLLRYITRKLAEGYRIGLYRFGILSPIYRKPRPGRNPKTGEPARISARVAVSLACTYGRAPHTKGKVLTSELQRVMGAYFGSRKIGAEFVTLFIDQLHLAYQPGVKVFFSEFGSFQLLELPQIWRQHPRTGKKVLMSEQSTIHFKASKNLTRWLTEQNQELLHRLYPDE